MKVLMISIDKGLLGKGQLGDVIERHKKYGEFCEKLDIIVFCKKGFEINKISDKVTAYPANSYNRPRYFRDAMKIGRKLFSENKYDLIVTQDPFLTGLAGYKLKKKFGAKLLVHFHGDFWQNKNWLKEKNINRLLLLISKFVTPRADAIRVMSQGQREKLLKAGIKEGRMKVISTPVNLDKYIDFQSADNKSDGKVILHIGRYDKPKDFGTLNKALEIIKEKLPDIRFIQVGAGDKIKKDIKAIPVESHPLTGHDDSIKFYYQADVVVLSSKSESFGKVLVEANACGKPVVSTATTGARDIVQNGYNGFLAPVGDAEALADKILYLLNNPDIAKKMGENGRNLVKEKFDGRKNTREIIQLWNDLIK